jgi:uncharacterized membrane protein YoaK (UPF0700 family)
MKISNLTITLIIGFIVNMLLLYSGALVWVLVIVAMTFVYGVVYAVVTGIRSNKVSTPTYTFTNNTKQFDRR